MYLVAPTFANRKDCFSGRDTHNPGYTRYRRLVLKEKDQRGTRYTYIYILYTYENITREIKNGFQVSPASRGEIFLFSNLTI